MMRRVRTALKTVQRGLLLAAVLALAGCKIELYAGVSQKEGNEMLALLRSEGISADKQPDKDGKIKLLVEESDIAEAVDALKRKGYPRESFSTLKDVFPKDGLISSPVEERARLNYAKAQEISRTLSEIDACWWRGCMWCCQKNVTGWARSPHRPPPRCLSSTLRTSSSTPTSPQIKQLVNNGIEGLSYDRISVVLVPSADVRQVPLAPHYDTLFSIQVTEDSRGRLIGLFGVMVALLLVSNAAQFMWHRTQA
jgi:type III secretion protein J